MARPDAFLRRVVAQREREQEEAILEAPLDRFKPRKCRRCGAGLRVQEESTREVCSRCECKPDDSPMTQLSLLPEDSP